MAKKPSSNGRTHKPPKVPSERPGPAGGKRDENRRKKVKDICDASLQLFCALGVESVTIDEVVTRAKIPKGSFYRYFSGKEELVATLFAPLVSELRGILEETERALRAAPSAQDLNPIYGRLAAEIARLVIPNPDLLRLYLQENRGPAMGARQPILRLARDIEKSACELTQIARDHGLVRADHNLRVGALTSLGAIERLLFAYVSGEAMGEPSAVGVDLVRVILDGIRA